jgi:photosystem II stability/assembly factor-like uncharacterized protein
VYASSPNVVMVIGPTGIRRSTDGGGSFTAVTSKAAARARVYSADRAGSSVFAYGNRVLIRSADGGKTWVKVRTPKAGIRRADFVDARNGFILDDRGPVYRTRNGGRTWTELPGVGMREAYGMAFSSATRGYLVIPVFGDVAQRSGFLLRTTDGGSTWHPQFVVSDQISAVGIAAPGGGTDYLLGGESSLLASRSGGDAGSPSELTITTKRRRLSRPAGITVTGRLKPAQGNERVTVSYRAQGTTYWQHQTVRTATNGSFTTSWRVRKGLGTFVAQWQGDFRSAGDGSPTIQVRVG